MTFVPFAAGRKRTIYFAWEILFFLLWNEKEEGKKKDGSRRGEAEGGGIDGKEEREGKERTT